jgi:hypothetical protein
MDWAGTAGVLPDRQAAADDGTPAPVRKTSRQTALGTLQGILSVYSRERTPWVQTSPHLRHTYFPNILKHDGHAKYLDAIEALTDYRQHHKSFHAKWSAIELVAREGLIKLNESETGNVVDLSSETWKEFVKNMSDAVVDALRGKVEGELKDAIQKGMQMSELGKLRMTILEKHLEFLGLLQKIREGVEARKLANLPKDAPEAIEFKVRYFIGLAAPKGEEYYKLRTRYAAYEKAHQRLRDYVSRENDLERPPMRTIGKPPNTTSSAAKKKPWTAGIQPPADAGLPVALF